MSWFKQNGENLLRKLREEREQWIMNQMEVKANIALLDEKIKYLESKEHVSSSEAELNSDFVTQ